MPNEERGNAMLTRRLALGASLGAALPLNARAQDGEGWPERPVRVVVPYPPGGAADVPVRILTEALRGAFGQPFVVENRPGAGGNIGVDAVAKAAPDGYTIGWATVNNLAINQYLYPRLPFDVERDITVASLSWEAPLVLIVPAEHVPARDLQEFVRWAKSQREGVIYSSPGIGTTAHLSAARFCRMQGVKAMHLPFRGAAEAMPALLRGDVNFAIDNLPSYLPVIREGKLRALAVTAEARWPDLPEVPTMTEAGVEGLTVFSWGAAILPARTPAPVVERLSAALRTVAADPGTQRRFAPTGSRPLSSTLAEAMARAAAERPVWAEAVRISGARLE